MTSKELQTLIQSRDLLEGIYENLNDKPEEDYYRGKRDIMSNLVDLQAIIEKYERKYERNYDDPA